MKCIVIFLSIICVTFSKEFDINEIKLTEDYINQTLSDNTIHYDGVIKIISRVLFVMFKTFKER